MEDYPIPNKDLLLNPSNSCEGTCDRFVANEEIEEDAIAEEENHE